MWLCNSLSSLGSYRVYWWRGTYKSGGTDGGGRTSPGSDTGDHQRPGQWTLDYLIIIFFVVFVVKTKIEMWLKTKLKIIRGILVAKSFHICYYGFFFSFRPDLWNIIILFKYSPQLFYFPSFRWREWTMQRLTLTNVSIDISLAKTEPTVSLDLFEMFNLKLLS